MSPASVPKFDTLVVGAGWAGLTCALRLALAGKRVLCIEARQRLGGRAFTHSWNEDTPMVNHERSLQAGESGYAVDFGCSYIHGYNEGNPVKEIAKKYNVNVHVAKPTAAQIIGPQGALSPTLTKRLQANLQSAQDAAKAKASELRAASPAATLAGQTPLSSALVDDASSPLYAHLQTDEERMLAAAFARLLHIPFGTEIESVALEYFGAEANYAGTDGIPEGGFSTLIAHLAREFEANGGQIRRGEVVSKISRKGAQQEDDKDGEGVQIVTRSADEAGKEHRYAARTAVVTVPLAVLKATHTTLFEPALETERQQAIKRTTVGNLNKVLLSYASPWWSAETGTFFILPTVPSASAPSTDVPKDLAQLFASTTLIVSSLSAPNGLPSHMTSPSLLVLIGGQHGKHLEAYDRLTVAEALHRYLAQRLTGGHAITPVRHTFYTRWSRHAFTGGATTTPVTLNNAQNDFRILAQPLWADRVHFAGEHCEPNHRGSVAGAVVSAETASEAVLKHLNGEHAHI